MNLKFHFEPKKVPLTDLKPGEHFAVKRNIFVVLQPWPGVTLEGQIMYVNLHTGRIASNRSSPGMMVARVEVNARATYLDGELRDDD